MTPEARAANLFSAPGMLHLPPTQAEVELEIRAAVDEEREACIETIATLQRIAAAEPVLSRDVAILETVLAVLRARSNR